MTNLRADRVFFYILLTLATVATVWLVRGFIGAVAIAATVAVIVYPVQKSFLRWTGNRNGPATGLTLATTVLLLVIPTLLGVWLFLQALVLISTDVVNVLQTNEDQLTNALMNIEQWVESTVLEDSIQVEREAVVMSSREFALVMGRASARWVASAVASVSGIVLPFIIFMSVLGTLLAHGERTVELLKKLSPLDDGIDQIFFDRLRSITRSMMLSIVVVALVQGIVTGVLMALVGTPHVVGLTVLATILAILPGGAAIVAVPVGILHILHGDLWGGIVLMAGTLTFVASLANQVRPRMVSKDVFLNRAFMLMCVFSGLAIFGPLGVVYGPMIMILFTTVIEVYLEYFRPGTPSVTVASPASALIVRPAEAHDAHGEEPVSDDNVSQDP